MTDTWQQALKHIVTSVDHLCHLLKIDPHTLPWYVDHHFPLRVPMSFVERMQPGDPHDPLLLQVLPRTQEQTHPDHFSDDPLDEQVQSPQPGIIHKYQGRVLLITSAACPIHCRYCFRRHFPYHQHQIHGSQWSNTLDYIQQDESIEEVIFSGGEPLLVADTVWAQHITALNAIKHLKFIRIHSRMPVVLPERITAGLIQAWDRSRVPLTLVVHSNHPHEINESVRTALQPLRHHGHRLLNQSVLLKDINDDAHTLKQLSEVLFGAGVMPYYLHLLDPISGSHHFEVGIEQARACLHRLASMAPGYLVPKLVKEVAHTAYKQPVESTTIAAHSTTDHVPSGVV